MDFKKINDTAYELFLTTQMQELYTIEYEIMIEGLKKGKYKDKHTGAVLNEKGNPVKVYSKENAIKIAIEGLEKFAEKYKNGNLKAFDIYK